MMLPLHLIYFITMIVHASLGFSDTGKLPQDEVRVLKEIAKKLGKKDWDFGKNPCNSEGNWGKIDDPRKGFASSVTCDCPPPQSNTSCHVITIALKSQNLSGTVPPEFAKFRHLKSLDLSRNYLSGSIPKEWATMQLEDLSFMGNRLSGPFPNVLTSITALRNLSLEGNLFSGLIPPQIGKLIHLERLLLSSNSFTGRLPAELGKLKNITDMRISDNNFSGRIPDFIGNWTQIQKLQMIGSGLEGPFPSTISSLTSLTDLRISDLKGKASSFPPLKNLNSLKTMILRKCLIRGKIPEYIGHMEKLKNLDLSFNQLAGEVPLSFNNMKKADFIYLTGNQLTGSVPNYFIEKNKNVDISYNNFTIDSSTPLGDCTRVSVNLAESYSPGNKTLKRSMCYRHNFPCSLPKRQYRYQLYINCGGSEVTVDGKKYEADQETKGASMFYYSDDKRWAFSSTGNFMDNDDDADDYIMRNTSKLSINASSSSSLKLYSTSRASPLSLTYYAHCLGNGNYTLKLHFAEIIFTDDRTFYSLGKRVFDVYIQGRLVLKDFDIQKAANGSGKPIIKAFVVNVTDHNLKINFYWAGKGTTGIPIRGVYGPLISALSVEPNFKPPVYHDKNTILIEVGTASVASLLLLIIAGVLWKKRCFMGKDDIDKELRGLNLQTGIFTLRQMKAATNNFDPANKIGEGGFGCVYKGVLSEGKVIAVKQLSTKSKQGNREFVTEIGMISALQHPNLVKLYGCCVEGNQLLLIYEYMENNCLSRALFENDEKSRIKLDWSTRKKICLGIAKGLAYLHEESRIKIVHRDIKASNVLLDKDLNAKISDFGLAKLNDGNTHISTRVAGTVGYMAPEYAMRGYLTEKADVYSFGVVALEIVSGKGNTKFRPNDEFVYLLDWAGVLQERGNLLELVDPSLGSEYSPEEAMVMLNTALLCTTATPMLRPTMTEVVSMLEGKTVIQEHLADPSFSLAPKLKAIRNHFWRNEHSRSQSQSLTMTAPCSTSVDSFVGPEEERSELLEQSP